MGRPWREEYKGGIYHVIARGNNKEHIFREDIDKGYFLKLMKEHMKPMGYVIYGFVMMNNHYHFIIQTLDRKLQEIMHQINNTYSKYFNSKYDRVGHVFEGRYKSMLVQDERYMLQLLRYIHQNPIRAKLCDRVEDFKWSSDIYYRKQINGFVNTEIIMTMIAKEKKLASEKYKEYMEQEEKEDYDKLQVIGDEAYQIFCKSRKEKRKKKSLSEILIDLKVPEKDITLIKAGSRKRGLTPYKLEYARKATENGYTNREIGDAIGMTDSAIKDMLLRYNK